MDEDTTKFRPIGPEIEEFMHLVIKNGLKGKIDPFLEDFRVSKVENFLINDSFFYILFLKKIISR